jgi:hypothetical protein
VEGEFISEVSVNLLLMPLQMKEPEPIRPSKGLAERICSKGTNISLFAVELEELVNKVSDFFPNQPPKDFLYIFVTLQIVCEC